MPGRTFLLLITGIALTGCAGKSAYTPPQTVAAARNTITIQMPLDEAWKSAVGQLSSKIFVINNIDKSSGLLNISYSGDPEKYIDCGRIVTSVENLRGKRTYDFAGAAASKTYEFMPDYLYEITRHMALEGRANILFSSNGPKSTAITVNTKYVVTRTLSVVRADGMPSGNGTDTISFTSGGSASFPAGAGVTPSTCIANGKFEEEILDGLSVR